MQRSQVACWRLVCRERPPEIDLKHCLFCDTTIRMKRQLKQWADLLRRTGHAALCWSIQQSGACAHGCACGACCTTAFCVASTLPHLRGAAAGSHNGAQEVEIVRNFSQLSRQSPEERRQEERRFFKLPSSLVLASHCLSPNPFHT